MDDTSELVHLTLELLVVLHDVTVESGHALGEVVLGGTKLVSDVEAGVTGLGSELAVDLHLGLLALGDGGVELAGLLGEHVGSVRAVLLHGGANLIELGGVVVSHGLEAGISRGLVGVDEALKLGVLLKVLLVALVTDLDHTVGLGTHVGVHLGLLELVLVDHTGELGDASVGLGDLLLHGGTEKVDLGLGGGDTGLGLLLGSSDVAHGLGEVPVVERLGGVEGRGHTGSGTLKGHIGVVTVSGHLGTDAAEVSGGLGHHNLQLVVSPLASGLVLGSELGRELGATSSSLSASVGNLLVKLVDGTFESLAGSLGILLDLGSIDGDVLVGLGNARVDRGLVGGHGALLGLDGNAQLVSGVGLVAGDTGTDQLGAMDVRAVATVSEDRSLVEAVLHEAHGTSEVILGLLGIDSHLVKKGTLELLACGLVEREVAVHLGAHGGHIALASGLLGGNLLLNIVEVVRQAHAAIGSVGEDGPSLLHVGGIHRSRAANAVDRPGGSEHRLTLDMVFGSNVHDRAADGKATQEGKGDAGTSHLVSRHPSSTK